MCILFLQLNHPEFAFVAASNRDEFLARPTAASHWHRFPEPSHFESQEEQTPSLASSKDGLVDRKGASSAESSAAQPSAQRPVLSGIDVHPNGGGTWLGVTRTGGFAALTNFTEFSPPPVPQGRGITSYRSRGSLPRQWLLQQSSGDAKQDSSLHGYLSDIASRMDEWPGFNFFAGNLLTDAGQAKIGYVTNRSENTAERVTYLPVEQGESFGVACEPDACASVGLSNSVLDKPWPKVTKGRKLFDDAIKRRDEENLTDEQLAQSLFDVLHTPPAHVKDDGQMEMMDVPSSIMVLPFKRNEKLGWYATRTSTIILVRRPTEADKEYTLKWWERDVHIVNGDDKVERCDASHERFYQTNLQAASEAV